MTLISTSPRTIAGTDLSIGPLGYGCWRLTSDPEHATEMITTALDNGMNLIDTADVYGLDWGGTGFGTNEELLGEVLAASPSLRDRMVLATKGGILPPTPYDSSSSYLTKALDDSLRRLRTDVIDIYMIHRPDMYTHPEQVASTLEGFVSAGKVRAIGVSNYTPAQTDALQSHLDIPLAVTQPQFSAAHLDPMRDGTLDQAMRDAIVPLAWSPLAGGRLATGEGLRPELVAKLIEIGDREGVHVSTVALAFVLAHPSRPVAIIGSQKAHRLVEATAALRVDLNRSDTYDIIEASEGVPLP
jgi:predicted oxidoreductase